MKEKKKLDVVLERGLHFGEKIVLRGEGDESVRTSHYLAPSSLGAYHLPSQPDSSSPGDLHIIVRPLPHPTFSIVPPPHSLPDASADLSTTLSLTLSESLLGFSRLILIHLDGRGLRVTQPPPGSPGWRVLKTGDEMVVKGEGMWRKGRQGDLILKIEVETPTEQWAMGLAEKGGVDTLRGLLPPRRPDLAEVCVQEGKETDDVELEEKQERAEEEEGWVRLPFAASSPDSSSLSTEAQTDALC